MAKFVNDELWKNPGSKGLIAVTTNSVAKKNGELVMGRGSALEAVQRIPGIAKECVRAIYNAVPGIVLDGTRDYGFLVVRQPTDTRIGFGILQAKRDWRETSGLVTISLALSKLSLYATMHPNVNIRTVIPGIGNGRIGKGECVDPQTIRALCEECPDNVTFCVRSRDINV